MFFDNNTQQPAPEDVENNEIRNRIAALDYDQQCIVLCTKSFTLNKLRKLTEALSVVANCKYVVRRIAYSAVNLYDENADQYTVTRKSNDYRVNRTAYPYATLPVGGHFCIPRLLEPTEANLRVYTSQQGRKHGFKFSVAFNKVADEYIITRKE